MIFIDEEECTLCGTCVEACPWQALSLTEGKLVIDRDLCTECGACLRLCPFDAIYQVESAPAAAVDAEATPVLRADTAVVVRPAKPERTPVVTTRSVAPSPWVGVLPLAARFAGGLASWWLDCRQLAACERRDYGMVPRPLRSGGTPAVSPGGPRRLRRRLRGGRGR
jgi:NAD-dependent dihydropyrimidine dehydrogenase PreA subunit